MGAPGLMSQPTVLLQMCEIAVTKTPEDDGIETEKLIQFMRVLYSQNDDGLGIVAVYRLTDDQFHYQRYKGVEPGFDDDESDLRTFVDENASAWRFVIHARLQTHGGVGFAETHPLQMDGCPECDVGMVVHNGMVRDSDRTRTDHEFQGHRYTTDVDSEVIGHAHGSVPEDLDEYEEPDISGRLNYLLFSEHGILVRTTRKYVVDDDTFQMTTRSRGYLDDANKTPGYHLVKPSGNIEFKKRTITVNTGSRYAGAAYTGGMGAVVNRTRDSRAGSASQSTLTGDDACAVDVGEGEDEVSPDSVQVHAGAYNLDDFGGARPGHLTSFDPERRHWVRRATPAERRREGKDYICLLHGHAFDNECEVCYEADAAALGFQNAREAEIEADGNDESREESESVSYLVNGL